MAAKGKDAPKIPDYVTTHEKQVKHAKKIGDTALLTHTKAYSSAVDKHLKGKDGLIDYNLLDNEDIQENFSQSMIETYQDSATAYFKTAKDLDKFQKDLLTRAYVGTTSDRVKELVAKHGSDLTYDVFNRNTRNIQNQINESLYSAAGSHLKEGHVKGLLSATKKKFSTLEDLVDTSKLDLEEASQLHRHAVEGNLSNDIIKQILPSYKIKKKKKKK